MSFITLKKVIQVEVAERREVTSGVKIVYIDLSFTNAD